MLLELLSDPILTRGKSGNVGAGRWRVRPHFVSLFIHPDDLAEVGDKDVLGNVQADNPQKGSQAKKPNI